MHNKFHHDQMNGSWFLKSGEPMVKGEEGRPFLINKKGL